MIVSLIHSTPPNIVVKAIRMCHDSFDKMDSNEYKIGENDKNLIRKIVLEKGHESVAEHCSFNWEINGLSEYAHVHLIRHRIGVSFSVQSTRYTFVKNFLNSKEPVENFVVDSGNQELMAATNEYMEKIRSIYQKNPTINKDVINQHIPRLYMMDLITTFNIRSLRHFIKLRNSKAAHYEIREVAKKMLEILRQTEYNIFLEDLED